jgi:hypothetical protein
MGWGIAAGLPLPFLFVPFFRVFGFLRSVTQFSAIGFDF